MKLWRKKKKFRTSLASSSKDTLTAMAPGSIPGQGLSRKPHDTAKRKKKINLQKLVTVPKSLVKMQKALNLYNEIFWEMIFIKVLL